MISFFNIEFVVKLKELISLKVPLANNISVFINPHYLSVGRSNILLKVRVLIGLFFDDVSFSVEVADELSSVAFE